MSANEQDDAATPRAGGDVIWKSASQVGSPDEKSNPASPEESESATRACGDGILKGASQKTDNSA